MNKFAFWAPMALLPATLVATPSLWANEGVTNNEPIERIIVTGELRDTPLDETPASISAMSELQLQERAAVHLEDVFNAWANVNYTGGASRARFMQIRGIGERSQFVDPIQPSVGLMIDGINYSGLGQAGQLFDIGQAELYRGPQSGSFGANAMAGMINLESQSTTTDFEGKWLAGVANYGEMQAGLALGGELGPLGLARLSVHQLKNDGFTENAFLLRDDTEQRREFSSRFNLQTELGDDWQLHTTLHYLRNDNGYDAFTLENDRVSLADQPGQDDIRSQAGRLALHYDGWEGSQLQFSVSYLQAETLYSFDEDWTFVGIAPGWEYSSFDEYTRERDDQTFELRWLSAQPLQLGSGELDWMLGLYHYEREVDLTRRYFYDGVDVFRSQYDTQNRAVYGELNYAFEPTTWISLGLRAERYENDYLDSNEVVAAPSDTMWGGRLALNHQLDSGTLLYGALSRGYKIGGVNGEALGRAQDEGLADLEQFLLEQAEFSPEFLTNAEFGIKGMSADERLTLRMAVFYNWRDDVQLKSWVNRDQSFVGFLDNADSGDGYGAEAELSYQWTPALRMFANLGWLRTEIDGFVTEDGVDMSGRDQAQAPRYQFNVGMEYWLTNHWQAVIQVDGRDDFYFSDSHDSQAEAYELLQAQLNYINGPWRISLWARNLTDEDYPIRGFFFGNDPRDEYVPETYVQYGEPRRVGLTVNYSF